MPSTHCIVLAGGEGGRLSGASRADVSVEGRHLLGRVMAGVHPLVSGRIIAAMPDLVGVPPGVFRTLEDPPVGGPLAGTNVGLKALSASATPTRAAAPARAAVPTDSLRGAPGLAALANGSAGEPSVAAQDMAFVFAADTPWTGILAPRLTTATHGRDGAVVVGEEPPFHQHLQAIYRIETLRVTIEEAGGSWGKGVRRMLAGLGLAEVPSSADKCRDVGTPEDVS